MPSLQSALIADLRLHPHSVMTSEQNREAWRKCTTWHKFTHFISSDLAVFNVLMWNNFIINVPKLQFNSNWQMTAFSFKTFPWKRAISVRAPEHTFLRSSKACIQWQRYERLVKPKKKAEIQEHTSAGLTTTNEIHSFHIICIVKRQWNSVRRSSNYFWRWYISDVLRHLQANNDIRRIFSYVTLQPTVNMIHKIQRA